MCIRGLGGYRGYRPYNGTVLKSTSKSRRVNNLIIFQNGVSIAVDIDQAFCTWVPDPTVVNGLG